ncbi:dihydrodipicolinate reductase [Novosphingobium kaempferiae]|uniref:NAD(P)H-dependent amine dehydrogenase family protein n=1 Tax=Novosphingobium kaempferiae TaxID=2896849 RepID=UPI001E5DB3C1|nr:dihydrodipicolinate reductase [Novosphingobium kaempferiae]
MTQRSVNRPIRVVQWATGTVGSAAMRAVLTHPDMELVGVKVYSEAKEGVDAGTLCGLPEVGLPAVRDLRSIIALNPDCVLYMPERTDYDDVCALLEHGINISSTRAEFFHPASMPTDVRARIEAACAAGNSSLHTSGSSPGFITEALPIVLLSLSRRLDLLTIDEFANCIDGCSEEMLLGVMGFGETPEAFAARQFYERDEVFNHSLLALAEAIGIAIDGFEVTSEVALAMAPTRLHETSIAAGTIAGQRMVTTGLRDGQPVLRFRCNWFVTQDIDKAWDLRADGWRVTVEGDTPFEISIGFPIPEDKRRTVLPNLTAHRPVNAIPYVCAASPGILTTADLPQVVAQLS